MDTVVNLLIFLIFALLWLAFLAALIARPPLLETTWARFRSQNIVVQLLLALLFLPVVIGLWVWRTPWPYWLRLILIAGLAWFTLYTFFPRPA